MMDSRFRWFSRAAVLAIALACLPGEAAELTRGKVITLAGDLIGLEFAGGNWGMGSKVELSYSTGDGDVIPYGYWCIDNVRKSLAEAGPQDRKWAITARAVDQQAPATIGLNAVTIPLEGAELVQWYEQASAAGCRGAALRLSSRYKYGSGVPQDENRAMELLREAAQDDHFEARAALADMFEDQVRVPSGDQARNDALRREAFQMRLRLAEDRYVMVYERVAHSYLIGLGTKVDLAQAEKWYRLAERDKIFKDKEPLVDLATYLEKVYGQPEKAVALLKEGARAGGKKAQAELQRRGLSW